LYDQLAYIIKTLDENRGVLLEKFKKGKRLHLVADLLGNWFNPPSPGKKTPAPTGVDAQKVMEFYNILKEFDRKYEFMGAMPDRFTKFYTTYLNKLKEIHKEITATATK
jgi:hypothetical protein